MTPDQFLIKIAKQDPAPVYLFLGPEAYQRRICREALLNKWLPGELRQEGFTRVDLEETSLTRVVDDACSLSLFANERVVWVTSAETALPRRISAAADDDGEEGGKAGPADPLASYLKAPTPGTVIVLECSRYDFTGDDKSKIDRVIKFYASIPNVVEFRGLTPESLRSLAQELARAQGLKIESRELAFLIDAVGGDAARLSTEIEKLALYAGDRKVTSEDLRALVPNASQSNIFSLVNALGRKDRAGALKSLDLLVRDGEYLPLALTFLGTQLRLTLAAQEAGLRNSQQIVNHFSKQGVRMWRDRAEQLLSTASVFRSEQLRAGLKLIYDADKGLRDVRPDDRTIMEVLVVNLTA